MDPGERFNTCSHLVGLLLAVLGVPLMLAITWPGRDAAKTSGALVFAASCVALYAASTLFHATRGPVKAKWQVVDHCAIYVLIAGTCTPFALVATHGAWRGGLLATVWGIAAYGICREMRSKAARPSLALYIGMGWLGVATVAPLVADARREVLAWLLAGAASYTAGTIFYVNRTGHRHAHGLWHLFVLGGTVSHYAAIAAFVR